MYGVTTPECMIQNIGNEYYSYTPDEIIAMLTRYNGWNEDAIKYGNEVYKTYLVFDKYNKLSKG